MKPPAATARSLIKPKGIVTGLLLLIVVTGLTLRGLHYAQMKANNPIFALPIVDAKEYVNNADYYLHKSIWGPPGAYFHPPLYSYAVAAVFAVFGNSLDAVRIVQIVLDTLSILLLFLIARRAFGTTAGLIGAGFYAIYVPIIQYTAELLPPILAVFLLLVGSYALLRFLDAGARTRAAPAWLTLAGLSYGMLVANLVSFILPVLLILPWLFWALKDRSVGTRVKWVAVFTLIVLLPPLTASARNYLKAKEPVFVSYNGGINFYIGNNPDIGRTVGLRPGFEYDRLVMIPYERARITNFADQSRFWSSQVGQFIRARPWNWLRIMIKKAILFFNAYEFPRNFDGTYFARYSFLHRLPLLRLDLLLPLSLAAVVLILLRPDRMIRRPPILLLVSVLFSYSFSIILFFVAGRYRLPVVPILCMLAGWFVAEFAANLRSGARRRIRQLGLYAGLAVLLFVATKIKYFPGSYPYRIEPAETLSQIGNALTEDRQYERARAFFEQGLVRPTDRSTYILYYHYASLKYLTGDTAGAVQMFKQSLELKPDNYRVYNELGYIYKMRGAIDTAIAYLTRSINLAPAFTLAYLNLGDCFIARQDWPGVVDVLESYYRRCPSQSPVISGALGIFYMDVFRDWTNAARHLKIALRHPQGLEVPADTYNRLGFCYYNLNDMIRAKTVWTEGLKAYPDFAPLRNNLQQLEY